MPWKGTNEVTLCGGHKGTGSLKVQHQKPDMSQKQNSNGRYFVSLDYQQKKAHAESTGKSFCEIPMEAKNVLAVDGFLYTTTKYY